MKHNVTLQEALDLVNIVNQVILDDKYSQLDNQNHIYKLCRERVIKKLGLEKGEYTLLYSLSRGRVPKGIFIDQYV